MQQSLLPTQFADAHAVRIESGHTLIAQQQPTSVAFLRSADIYEQHFLKFPAVAICHSYPELLHLALLEGEVIVTSYVPQPFSLRVSGRRYVPDCYVVRDGQRYVLELKPRAEFDEALRRPLEAFFALHGMRFEVVANEAMLARETEALNWLWIVRTLVAAAAFDTASRERAVWERVWAEPEICIGDLVDAGDRIASFTEEIAIFRLLHRGQLTADLTTRPLDYETGVKLCT
jgi:hypothetical protein